MIFKNKIIFFFFYVLLQSILSIANATEVDVDYDEQYSNCVDESDFIDNATIYSCSQYVSDDVLLQIDKVYGKIKKELNKSGKLDKWDKEQIQEFKSSQEAWLQYRDKQCKLEGFYIGSPYYTLCPMYMNINRLSELKTLLNEVVN